jgi:hypothetical protein
MRCLAKRRSGEIVSQAAQRVEARQAGRCDHTVTAALAMGDARRLVTELARATGTGVRALSHRCRLLGLPRPVTLLGWSRALHVVAAMEWDGESLQDVAIRAGDSTSRDCAEHVRYHTGRAPVSWSRSGGVDALLDAFTTRFTAGKATSVRPLRLVPRPPLLEAVL